MIPMFLLDEKMQARIEEDRQRYRDNRLRRCVAWDPKMPYDEELNLLADTYEVRDLFPEVHAGPEGSLSAELFAHGPQYYAESPAGRWRYSKPTIPRGTQLSTYYSTKIGSVLWDGPIVIPSVHRRPRPYGDKDPWKQQTSNPYMSHTPMEILSLRTGTRRAKGRVIVAGLGLGHQLIEVSKRKKVSKLTLVEISQELVDWIYPRIEPHLGMEVEVVVGDAYKLLPDMSADVALLDTFEGYGSNHYKRDDMRDWCEDIGFIWAWGSADMPERSSWY